MSTNVKNIDIICRYVDNFLFHRHVQVGRRMLEQVRSENLLVIFGGDEIGAIVSQDSRDSFDVIAECIIEAVRAPIILSNDKRSTSVFRSASRPIQTTSIR